MSKLVRVSVLSAVVCASGCIVFPAAPRGERRDTVAARPLWATRVVDGPAPAGIERAIRESGTVGSAAWTTSSSVASPRSSSIAWSGSDVAAVTTSSRPLALHLAFEDTVEAPPALSFLAGMTLLTVPAMQWHEVVVRGWVTDGDERLYEAHARRQVLVAWTWWGVFAPWLWTGPDGESAVDESVHAMTREVIADLVAQHEVRPPPALEATPVEEAGPAPWDAEPEVPGPAPWDAEPEVPAPAPWDAEEPEASTVRPTEGRGSVEAGAPVEPKVRRGDSPK